MRIDFIDGLRGIFAILVVYIHYSLIFYQTLPLGFYTACFMVCGFFIISGFILSYRFWLDKNLNLLTSAALRRYVRLTAAPLISVLIAYVLMKFNLMYNREVGAITDTTDFMMAIYNFTPTLRGALKEGLWSMYFAYDQINSYNPVLWTMEYELKGSFLSMAFLAIFGKIKNRLPLYLIFIVLTVKTLYLTFVIGIMLSDFFYSDECKKYRESLAHKTSLSLIFLVLGLFLSFYALDAGLFLYNKMQLSLFNRMQINAEIFYHILGATMIIYAVLQLKILQKIFARQPLSKVGEYSFSLYLIHAPILLSLGGFIFMRSLNQGHAIGICVMFGVLSSILATIPATIILHRCVDIPAAHFAKRVEKFFK